MKLSRFTLTSVAFSAALLATMDVPMAQTGQPVTVDVVVLDGNGKPVSGLAQDRFEVRDDGTRVTIQSFEEVKVAPGKRTVIFVLDDVGVPASGTVAIQNITRALVSSAQPGDNVSVLHLHGKGQGLENDPPTVLGRIDSYIAGSARATRDAAAESTTFIADLAEKLQPLGPHRKTIVCVGSTGACNVSAPSQTVDNLRMESWNRAITAAARANAAVYVVVPSTTVGVTAEGLSAATGGEVLPVANNIAPLVERVWADGSNHYLLTYQPTTKNARDTYRVQVQVEGRGLRALARGYRGR